VEPRRALAECCEPVSAQTKLKIQNLAPAWLELPVEAYPPIADDGLATRDLRSGANGTGSVGRKAIAQCPGQVFFFDHDFSANRQRSGPTAGDTEVDNAKVVAGNAAERPPVFLDLTLVLRSGVPSMVVLGEKLSDFTDTDVCPDRQPVTQPACRVINLKVRNPPCGLECVLDAGDGLRCSIRREPPVRSRPDRERSAGHSTCRPAAARPRCHWEVSSDAHDREVEF